MNTQRRKWRLLGIIPDSDKNTAHIIVEAHDNGEVRKVSVPKENAGHDAVHNWHIASAVSLQFANDVMSELDERKWMPFLFDDDGPIAAETPPQT